VTERGKRVAASSPRKSAEQNREEGLGQYDRPAARREQQQRRQQNDPTPVHVCDSCGDQDDDDRRQFVSRDDRSDRRVGHADAGCDSGKRRRQGGSDLGGRGECHDHGELTVRQKPLIGDGTAVRDGVSLI